MVDIMRSREEVEVEEGEWGVKMRGKGKGEECCQGKNIFPAILSYSRILAYSRYPLLFPHPPDSENIFI